jgi:hypothetical protein
MIKVEEEGRESVNATSLGGEQGKAQMTSRLQLPMAPCFSPCVTEG